MIIRRFLLWARTAPAGHRAEAVAALARAYLTSDLSPEDRAEAETGLTAMLDDPSPLVRRALAESLGAAEAAPRPIVLALANDQSDIAALVLSRSPVLQDPELIDLAALGDELVQTAIARRAAVSVPLAAALAEVGTAAALVALLDNPGAAVSATSLARLLDRHGDDPELREALLRRPDLPLDIRQSLAAAVSASLSVFVSQVGWLSRERSDRMAREARDRATLALTAEASPQELARLVAHLRRSAQLTSALILRALLSSANGFVAAALADLSGLPSRRVQALLKDRRGAALHPLYLRAGLPAPLWPAFAAAVEAGRSVGQAETSAPPRLSRPIITAVLDRCTRLAPDEAGPITALLRRFEVEAAREEAAVLAEALAQDAALTAVLTYLPEALIEGPDRADRAAA